LLHGVPTVNGEWKVCCTSCYDYPSAQACDVELEAVLILCGAILPSEVHQPGLRNRGNREEEDDDDDSDDPTTRRPSAAALVNGKRNKNIRSSTKKGDDSDSDFDI
jgi:hypothetical protein